MEPSSEQPVAPAAAAPVADNNNNNNNIIINNAPSDAPDNKKRKFDGRDRDSKRGRGRGGRSMQHGSHAHKKKGMGRSEHFESSQLDRRARNEVQQAKNEKKDDSERSALPAPFAKEEVDAEERRPKRKVAVMLGYSGTGYKGMQIDNKQKTIEGDLFNAFVKAGAISKANADDPKKSSLVRCARTDKGVHAAGNVISLKLIIEDEDIVDKINSHLTEQIRVWGMQRTTGSFSCYQACDSRWYEYLIPTHSFLPPHPSSFMGKKLVEYAEKKGELDGYKARQAEVWDFWSEVEEKHIKPILETLDDSLKPLVHKALYEMEYTDSSQPDPIVDAAADIQQPAQTAKPDDSTAAHGEEPSDEKVTNDEISSTLNAIQKSEPDIVMNDTTDGSVALPTNTIDKHALETALKNLKKAYLDAKRAYRISPERQQRVQDALDLYLGTHKFHNYTIQKKFNDKSSQRYIKSFKVAEKPIIINNTEWLSLKVHGQSFMMHQIRKMVGMAALSVRCGTHPEIMRQSFGDVIMRIPKAPGLGLLLERPVFDSYNANAAKQHDKEPIDFSKYDKQIEEFKEREIYQRIFREEAQGNQFHTFFTHLDNYRDATFLYLTAGGLEATKEPLGNNKKKTAASWDGEESEDENPEGGEG